MADVMVVVSKIKAIAKTLECNTSGDVAPVLSEIVERIVRKGIDRAKADGRKTLKARDIDPADARP